ncbi:MAG: hypothetical protein E5Y10_24590 [Mesorhizobium sp.]|nr:MAG: hypothetical protein E5Y10_24590 [Mesorhizobium sp.]
MNATDRISEYQAFFKRHGYFVVADAIPGEECLWADTLAEAAKKVERVLSANAKRHGFRGLSRNAIDALHRDLPSPTWGVELDA